MESTDSMDNQPSISCGFVETMQLYVGHGGYGRPYGITYTEDGAGSSPVPPTILKPPKGGFCFLPLFPQITIFTMNKFR
jgi:hypothetical protein